MKNFISYIFTVGIILLVSAAIVFNFYMGQLKPIKNLERFIPNHVTQIISQDDVVIKTFGVYKNTKVNSQEIPDLLKNAFISIEDKNFYKHEGYDLTALLRSTIVNIQAGRSKQGASTITQQLARILFLSSEKTYTRKLKELILARRIEKTWTKDQILAMYLNNVYLGEGAYGVGAAADVYFNKKLKDLTVAEAALIAGLPQAPSVYSPYQNKDLAIKRRNQVIKRMYANKIITKEQMKKALDEPVKLRDQYISYSQNKAPYFSDYVMRELEALGFSEDEISQGGYKIYTTLNYEYQQVAQDKLWSDMRSWGMTKDEEQAALFSYETSTGKILAYIGGKDYSKSQFDRASQSVRPPGSAFKVLVYTTAVEMGMSPNMLFKDEPYTSGDWSPHNYGNKYRGEIPAYQALAYSSNVVAAKIIIDYTGVSEVIRMSKRMGINTPLENDPTICLGSNGVKLTEMTNAFGVLANGGIWVKPYAVEKVVTPTGKVVYEANTNYKRILSLDNAAKVVEMMKQVVTSGTGRAANIGGEVAGKTGTTDNYRDAWFVGFTPNIVTGVWVGNDNNHPMRGLTGGTLPAKIWADYMRIANMGKEQAFPFPKFELNAKEFDTQSVTEEVVTEGETPENSEGQTVDENNSQVQEKAAPEQPPQPAPIVPNRVPQPAQPKPVDIHQDVTPQLRTIIPNEE
ncbi:MAG: PBP1A family penicillin-binding protein [Candidatus Gastranaerophilales bacterium]|nr:PBP1A family penicillin-binding protein [Candidatus Gastranaerophilales bacterium]